MKYEATVEATISEMSRICAAVPESAQLKRRNLVGTESITYSDDHVMYDITLGNNPGNFTHINGPVVMLGGPLNVVMLGTLSDPPGQRYVIEFDNRSGDSARAYGSVQIYRNTQTEPDSLFTFLSGWRRCK